MSHDVCVVLPGSPCQLLRNRVFTRFLNIPWHVLRGHFLISETDSESRGARADVKGVVLQLIQIGVALYGLFYKEFIIPSLPQPFGTVGQKALRRSLCRNPSI